MTEPASIRIRTDGPYVLAGLTVHRKSADQIPGADLPIPTKPGKSAAAVLCRCGLSTQKPFCDGTHRGRFDGAESADFPTGAAAATPEAAAAARPPAVGVIDNGPLRLADPVTLELSDGRSALIPAGVELCRCGHSSTKPYCDGTHAGIDFLDSASSDSAQDERTNP